MLDEESQVKQPSQVCYIPGNPVFSCINPPRLLSTNGTFDSEQAGDNGIWHCL